MELHPCLTHVLIIEVQSERDWVLKIAEHLVRLSFVSSRPVTTNISTVRGTIR